MGGLEGCTQYRIWGPARQAEVSGADHDRREGQCYTSMMRLQASSVIRQARPLNCRADRILVIRTPVLLQTSARYGCRSGYRFESGLVVALVVRCTAVGNRKYCTR